MRIYKKTDLITAGDMSDDIESPSAELDNIFGFAVQAIWTGTPTGTLKLQCSNNGVNWDDIADSSVSTGGADGSNTWNVWSGMYPRVRLVYTSVSGTGSLDVSLNAKGQ